MQITISLSDNYNVFYQNFLKNCTIHSILYRRFQNIKKHVELFLLLNVRISNELTLIKVEPTFIFVIELEESLISSLLI